MGDTSMRIDAARTIDVTAHRISKLEIVEVTRRDLKRYRKTQGELSSQNASASFYLGLLCPTVLAAFAFGAAVPWPLSISHTAVLFLHTVVAGGSIVGYGKAIAEAKRLSSTEVEEFDDILESAGASK